jgi:hypothetical protein
VSEGTPERGKKFRWEEESAGSLAAPDFEQDDGGSAGVPSSNSAAGGDLRARKEKRAGEE